MTSGEGQEPRWQASNLACSPGYSPVGGKKKGSLVKQAKHAGERARTKPFERFGPWVLPLHGHVFVPRASGAPGSRGFPGGVVGAAATPWREGQRAAALALRVRGLVDEGQILAGVIQRRGRGRRRRLGLLRGCRGWGPAGRLRCARRRRQEGLLLLRWQRGRRAASLGHTRRHCAGPAGRLCREAAHLRGEEKQSSPGGPRPPQQPRETALHQPGMAPLSPRSSCLGAPKEGKAHHLAARSPLLRRTEARSTPGAFPENPLHFGPPSCAPRARCAPRPAGREECGDKI